ncbi:hypothetical protein L1987_43214 [Smallanthus sonchifolius]|uniref:Uncharacterized protein n=1 Tax=Smallanthus sonchifolius TaxID=185202 RepID=A0ACB9GM87_9ASTR|nr:hypothetical protein L1987_43214 [Smallanthus sonchifolius]
MTTPPTSPFSQEHDVPILSSQEPKRRRLGRMDDTSVYDEPFHILSLFQCTMEQALAAFVDFMDREIQNMRNAEGEITGLLERERQVNEKIEKLTAELADTDHYHENLVDSFHQMETRVDTLEASVEVAQERIVQLETQLEAALEAEDAQDDESEEEPADEEDDKSIISSTCIGI